MGNATPPTLNAEIIAIYQESFMAFVQAHQSIADYGGQMTFDVAPGGELLTVNTRKNLGKVKVTDWKSVKGKLK